MIRQSLTKLFQSVTVELNGTRTLRTSAPIYRDVVDRREMLRSVPATDEGTAGEKTSSVDSVLQQKLQLFPTASTPDTLFYGIPFKEIPIIDIRVSHNNTILGLTDAKGTPKLIRSCGMEGFKNTRKGTNIAAQATAITMGTKTLEKGVKTVRVRVRGLGPGRMSAIKGLQMAGLNIVSITDNTRVSWTPPRPRKERKL
ncbi:28S ribosomal protein S11, mitochondrial [Anthonomus grandis grandis]|uniref:28S ribosomal protein S11, mitochondrial n=1 Tax=Anthonomus grandis grandis TaxID=2921223 RepID=UPI0021668AD2|nr:28S ribosomal protein S11, mitochondrial [Anthonomus grandis grandis]